MESFYCDACKYKTFRKYDFNKHMKTKKHKSRLESFLSQAEEKEKSESRDFCKKVVKESTNRAQMSTNSEKESTNGAQKSTKEHKVVFLSEKVSTNGAQMSTNEHKVSTNEHNLNSNENENINLNEYSNINNYSNNDCNYNNSNNLGINSICEYCFETFKSKAI